MNPNFSRLALRFGYFWLQIRILRVEISPETDSEVWTPKIWSTNWKNTLQGGFLECFILFFWIFWKFWTSIFSSGWRIWLFSTAKSNSTWKILVGTGWKRMETKNLVPKRRFAIFWKNMIPNFCQFLVQFSVSRRFQPVPGRFRRVESESAVKNVQIWEPDVKN